MDGPADVIVAFVRSSGELAQRLPGLAERIFPAGGLWIAWPRRAAGHVSDVTDNVVREHVLPLGLVDVKVALSTRTGRAYASSGGSRTAERAVVSRRRRTGGTSGSSARTSGGLGTTASHIEVEQPFADKRLEPVLTVGSDGPLVRPTSRCADLLLSRRRPRHSVGKQPGPTGKAADQAATGNPNCLRKPQLFWGSLPHSWHLLASRFQPL